MMDNNSGIHSLAGFSYQIKIFIYYASNLKNNEQIEFEGLEDVSIRNSYHRIDENSDKFSTYYISADTYRVIQVKRTAIDEKTSKKIIYNWLLLANKNINIEKYILVSDTEYHNSGKIFDRNIFDFYNEIMASKKIKSALITKVKNAYNGDYDNFKNKLENIQRKYEFINKSNIDSLLESKYQIHFRKAANSMVFYERLKNYLQEITVDIMSSVDKGNKYVLTYSGLLRKIEDICKRFTENEFNPIFADFRRLQTVDLKDTKVASSREYKQLSYCGDESFIKKHLLYNLFYKELREKYKIRNDKSRIESIEYRTFDNFETVKGKLIRQNCDSPINRLEETNEKTNSYCVNEEIKFGSAIFLTRKIEQEKQISWKDDNDDDDKD